jgi:hypothetical protein
MPGERPSVKNEEQYEALKDKGMSKERAARIANSPEASKHGANGPDRAGAPRRGARPRGGRRSRAARADGRATARERSS